MREDMAERETAGSHARGFSVSSFMLAIVFAYSASVQLNDLDWYLWLPLYGLASFVCLANAAPRFTATGRKLSDVGLVSGSILLVKVVLEGCYQENFEWKDLIFLDMNQRLVREMLGSSLVCLSMWSCVRTTQSPPNNAGKAPRKPLSGMLLLSVMSICLSVVYFTGRK